MVFAVSGKWAMCVFFACVPTFEGGFLQHLHGIELASIRPCDLFHQKNLQQPFKETRERMSKRDSVCVYERE